MHIDTALQGLAKHRTIPHEDAGLVNAIVFRIWLSAAEPLRYLVLKSFVSFSSRIILGPELPQGSRLMLALDH